MTVCYGNLVVGNRIINTDYFHSFRLNCIVGALSVEQYLSKEKNIDLVA